MGVSNMLWSFTASAQLKVGYVSKVSIEVRLTLLDRAGVRFVLTNANGLKVVQRWLCMFSCCLRRSREIALR